MPVHKVPGGYRWGEHGKVYPDKASAERQGRAIEAAKAREDAPAPAKPRKSVVRDG